ncbi:MAG: 5'-nucleotidase C-terminal domain-containing protein [Candidatus Aminicenantes bacterium]|nr:5'-nucleotidase C-terminal domain-containing protein [Candidatus Aminicenantes bacterium]
MNKKIFSGVLALVFLLAFAWTCSADELKILHVNDTHSHLFPFGPNDDFGGLARMSTLIKKLKGDNVLTLHSGDVFVGTFAFNRYFGYPELKIMEQLYDVMCLGNHEFDFGIDTLVDILKGEESQSEEVELPILCANLELPAGHPLFDFVQSQMILEVGGIRVGLLGVVTTDEYNYSPDVLAVLSDPYQAAGEAAYSLKYVEGCDVVICLSHLGLIPDRQGLSQVPGIDIIVGGHSHDLVEAEIVNGKIIVQAGEFGKYLGELTVDVNTENNSVSLIEHTLHPINRRVRKDPTLLQKLAMIKNGILDFFGPVYSQSVAKAQWDMEERLGETPPPYRDTALGNLVADAIKTGVSNAGYPVDCAIEASGFIAHKVYKGKIVGNDILRAVPYFPYGRYPDSRWGAAIKVALLAGQQILAGLEFSVSLVEYTDDLCLQVSGITFEYDSSKPPAPLGSLSRVDPFSVKINGAPINPNGLYWVAINEHLVEFLQSLGLVPFNLIEPSPAIYEYIAVHDFMKQLKKVTYTSEGRIVDNALK